MLYSLKISKLCTLWNWFLSANLFWSGSNSLLQTDGSLWLEMSVVRWKSDFCNICLDNNLFCALEQGFGCITLLCLINEKQPRLYWNIPPPFDYLWSHHRRYTQGSGSGSVEDDHKWLQIRHMYLSSLFHQRINVRHSCLYILILGWRKVPDRGNKTVVKMVIMIIQKETRQEFWIFL